MKKFKYAVISRESSHPMISSACGRWVVRYDENEVKSWEEYEQAYEHYCSIEVLNKLRKDKDEYVVVDFETEKEAMVYAGYDYNEEDEKLEDNKKDEKMNNEIRTEDCVRAIQVLFGVGNWKRISKKGSEIIERIFENKDTGVQVKVNSTKTEIISIEKMGMEKKEINTDETIYSLIKKEILKQKPFENRIYLYRVVQNIIPESEIPMINCDGETEQLDFENFEIEGLNEKELVVFAGGDWQEPKIFSLTINNGILKRDKKTKKIKSDSQHLEDIIEKCFGTKNPSELNGIEVHN